MSGASASRATSRKRLLQERVAVRDWLAKHGPWHSELPIGVTQERLDVELQRLVESRILSVWSWREGGMRFEPRPLSESGLVTSRVYTAGPLWDTYVQGWDE